VQGMFGLCNDESIESPASIEDMPLRLKQHIEDLFRIKHGIRAATEASHISLPARARAVLEQTSITPRFVSSEYPWAKYPRFDSSCG
jgi:hypothetical protein